MSTNWLISKLASFYVETVRNIPVLLQLIVWWDILRVSAPGPREAWQPLPDVFISNRGVIYPVPIYNPVHLWVGLALLLGIVASVFVTRWARARQMATGEQFPVLKVNAALIIGLPLLVFVIGGMPRSSSPCLSVSPSTPPPSSPRSSAPASSQLAGARARRRWRWACAAV